jgi:hypothetical protein
MILQTLQAISIIAGGIYFLIEYHNNNQTEHKKETLKYADAILEKELSDSLLDLDLPFQSAALKPEMDRVLTEGYQTGNICPTKTFYTDNFLSAYYQTDDDRKHFYSSLTNLTRFFKSISVCVSSGTCDLNTACDFFFDDAKDLVTDHCIEFDRYRLQFGNSPSDETEQLLAECNALPNFPRKYQSLTFCEGIAKQARKTRHLDNLSSPALLAALYKSCPFANTSDPPTTPPTGQNKR